MQAASKSEWGGGIIRTGLHSPIISPSLMLAGTEENMHVIRGQQRFNDSHFTHLHEREKVMFSSAGHLK